MRAGQVLSNWIVAVLSASLLGSVIQTQFNLARISGLGVPVAFGTRLDATLHDLLHFAPTYALLVTIAFAAAWPVAAMIARRVPGQRSPLFALAGFAAIVVMIMAMNTLLPVTPVAATRSAAGVLALAIAGAAAGWLYAWSVRPGKPPRIQPL